MAACNAPQRQIAGHHRFFGRNRYGQLRINRVLGFQLVNLAVGVSVETRAQEFDLLFI